tara:strand:- start:5922 stop:7154 length:1233 start_codon:yes stop_codon:yes gene_type:complete
MIPYGRQSIDDEDIVAVVRALKSDYLTTGPEVDAFEKELAERVGAKHVIAVSSGTAALHMAMAAVRIGPGDHVITSANTFLASANCAAYLGATPDFADIDPVSYNLSVESLEETWQGNTKAVVAVDFAGQPCDYPRITQLARERGAVVIQDASHSLGGSVAYSQEPISGLRSTTSEIQYPIGCLPGVDMTTFSFHPVKTMTTAEGGAVATDRDDLAEFCREFRTHGMVRDSKRFQTLEPGPWVYEMQHLGFNYRITDLQCALGRNQLRKLDQFVQRRAEIVAHYNDAFADLDYVTTPKLGDWLGQGSRHQAPSTTNRIAWHLYVLQINFNAIGSTRSAVMEKLREAGVGTQVHYIPVHLQPWYRENFGYCLGKCPNVESYYQRCLSLPLYPAMTDRDVRTVIATVKMILP